MARSRKHNGGLSDDALAFATSFAMSGEFEHVRNYVDRGRRYAALNSSQLREHWIKVLRALPPDPVDYDLRLSWDDLKAELSLRGEQPPYEEAKTDVEAFCNSVSAHIERLQRDDPDEFDRQNRHLTERFKDFARRKPPN